MKLAIQFGNSLRRCVRDESGQGLTEYVIILSFAIGTAVAVARSLRVAIDRGILVFGGELEKDLKTGRTQLGAWKN